MVLPGLAPHHTRQSMGSRSRLYTEKHAPHISDFLETSEGLWLLPRSIAERDRTGGIAVLGKLATIAETSEASGHVTDRLIKGSRLLGRTAITETGCMVNGLRRNQQLAKWVIQLAEWDWGSPSFDEADDIPYLHICDNDECYNPRHYDIEFSRPTLKERKVELNPNDYTFLANGHIRTMSGDILPSLEESLKYFIDFQKKNYPFVPIAKSKLSATSTSQIRFHPVTGCWEAWQYYCKPQDNLNWQFDGYGRLYQKYTASEIDQETGEVIKTQRRGHWMAHRVVWNATGRRFKKGHVLNHICSYRRCCNPLHLEQVTHGENTSHGARTKKARRDRDTINGVHAPSISKYISPKDRLGNEKDILDLYREFAA